MYSCASSVAVFCPNLTGGSPNFWEGSTPPRAAVEEWLSTGCMLIHSALEAAGYDVPVTTSTEGLYGEVRQLETFYGVAMAEYSRRSSRVSTQERTRAEVFMELFEDGMKKLAGKDLAQVGLSVSGTAKIHIGGISKTRKETVEEDTDRVEPRFYREQFRFPGTASEYDEEE